MSAAAASPAAGADPVDGPADGPFALHRARFADLSVADLYDLLALRARVFVVEQSSAYLDLDGRDPEPSAWHVWARHGARMAGVLRLLAEPGGVARVGRVVTAPEFRGRGVADRLMREALALVEGPSVLGAQVRVRGFYERFGYRVAGPEYDEDGIPHVPMRRPGPARRAPSSA